MSFTTANEYRQIECCLFDNSINRLLRNLQFRNDAVSDVFMASKNSKLLKVPVKSQIFRTRKSGVSLIICQWIECKKLTSKWLFFYLYFYANKACFNLTLKTKNKRASGRTFYIHASVKMNDYTDLSLDFTAYYQ